DIGVHRRFPAMSTAYRLRYRGNEADIQLRFFHTVRDFPHAALARLTQIDYDREMAFIAWSPEDGGETLGVARAIADPDRASAEFAILVRSDLKGKGLGGVLMKKLIGYCRESGVGQLVGDILAANPGMLALARSLGFELTAGADPGVRRARIILAGSGAQDTRSSRSP
ncbi:MAG TPA: GNAT family N-acetyltransferase, partial [Burkholderiales bacterium]|nr:GNAT family N-acetyltransferase [Burkholderiales bacterium]